MAKGGKNINNDARLEEFVSALTDRANFLTKDKDISNDLVQEVVLLLLEKQNDLTQIDDKQAYFFTVLRNRYYKYINSLEYKAVKNSNEIENIDIPCELSFDCDIEYEQMMKCLEEVEQSIVEMTDVDGMKKVEIAKKLGMSESNVRKRLKIARQKIKEYVIRKQESDE